MTQEDPVHAYLEAQTALDQATAKVKEVVDIIQDASMMLNSWSRVAVSNSCHGFPMEVALGSGFSIDAQNWPSGEKIAQVLADWHQKRQALESAWDRVPGEYRSGLQPPERR